MDVAAWIEAYAEAWRACDADAAAALFAEDAVYWDTPCGEPNVGREGVRRYWREATGRQSEIELVLGEPLVTPTGTAVEWWVTLRLDGELLTVPGCLLLRFDGDGRCVELREYWNATPGRHEAPPGWGRF